MCWLGGMLPAPAFVRPHQSCASRRRLFLLFGPQEVNERMNGTNEAARDHEKMRARRSYVMGILSPILRDELDLATEARVLDELLTSRKYRYNEMEKIALGYIATIVDKDVPREQLVAIACKIRDFYHRHA